MVLIDLRVTTFFLNSFRVSFLQVSTLNCGSIMEGDLFRSYNISWYLSCLPYCYKVTWVWIELDRSSFFFALTLIINHFFQPMVKLLPSFNTPTNYYSTTYPYSLIHKVLKVNIELFGGVFKTFCDRVSTLDKKRSNSNHLI
jgi:hypothetical protein